MKISKWNYVNNKHTKTHSLCCHNRTVSTACQIKAGASKTLFTSVFTLVLPFPVKTCCSTVMPVSIYNISKRQKSPKISS